MKKTAVVLTTLALTTGLFSPVAALGSSQSVSGVSAYYRVDLGYKVGWKAPSNTSGIAGYIVTAQPGGNTCVIARATAKECTFTTRALGFTRQYTFTVATIRNGVAVATSAPSNPVSAASIPVAPLALASNVVSNTQVDVAWIPSSNTGGAPLYGYTLTYWKSDTRGNPINSTKTELVLSETFTSLSVEPGFMYIINVASCNAYGCSSAEKWSYANTGATNVVLPRVISGGTAATTCFESIYDANAGETELGSCGSVVANPDTYPVIDSSATKLNIQLETKFAQSASFGRFASSYSLATWGPIGLSWFAFLNATSKSVANGFEVAPVVTSTTPTICEVVGPKIIFKSVGRCGLSAYVDGNGVFERSNTATTVLNITN
jgi:hypothetical protein